MMRKNHNLTREKAIRPTLHKTRMINNCFQDPSYRRHSSTIGGTENEDSLNVINFGEDVLFEKICQSEENVSRRGDYKTSGKFKRWKTEYWIDCNIFLSRKSVMFPLTIKDLTVGSSVYNGSIYTYSDIGNTAITCR